MKGSKDPRNMQFTQLSRKLVDDDDNRGLNCRGCMFNGQKFKVCQAANDEALKRGLRDCDAVDQFGEVVIYVPVVLDPRQLDLLGESDELD